MMIWSTYHFKYFQNNQYFLITLPLPTLKLTLLSGEVVGSIFFAKMRGKNEPKGSRSNFTLQLCVFEQRGGNCLGVVATPLRKTRVDNNVRDLDLCVFVLKRTSRLQYWVYIQ